jgi:hypothetical protein
MYIVPIAWLYVALMMGVAEATNTTGTVLGGLVTFVLYGVGPVALVLYLMGSPARRKAIRAREAQEALAHQADSPAPSDLPLPAIDPEACRHATRATQSDAVAPVRKEP